MTVSYHIEKEMKNRKSELLNYYNDYYCDDDDI